MVRKPKVSPQEENGLKALSWHEIECELVTPMYGGGVESTVIDEKMPIRVSSIRGQLRFWWRLLAEHKWKLGNAAAIREAEFNLWGGMGDADGGNASQVLLRVENFGYNDNENFERKVQNWASYEPNKNNKEVLRPKDWANAPYALFPAQGRTKDKPQEEPHALLREGLRWTLKIAFIPKVANNPSLQEQVLEALRWWSAFGGVGSRTRRGLGALRIVQSDIKILQNTVTLEEVEAVGFQLILRGQPSENANAKMSEGVQMLSKFRQAPDTGRNPGQQQNRPGRSRWPEPDALRRIFRKHQKGHEPEHKAGEVFPRALFGLPIITKFNDRAEPNNGDPFEISLCGGERLPSPVIIRPYFAGEKNGEAQWQSAALILPYRHLLDKNVKVDSKGEYPIWRSSAVQHIRPVHENNGADPIQAFINYFKK